MASRFIQSKYNFTDAPLTEYTVCTLGTVFVFFVFVCFLLPVYLTERNHMFINACTLCEYLYPESTNDSLCQVRSPMHQCNKKKNSGRHSVSPTPSSVRVCVCMQLWFGALIDCLGNLWDGGSQACIRKPLSPHMCLCTVWGICTNLPHKALIYLGYGSLLAPPSFYLSLCDETGRAHPHHNGM